MAKFRYVINPFTGDFDAIKKADDTSLNQTPKLIATFSSDAGTLPGDFVRVSGANEVTKIVDNSNAEMPNGIFGICFSKPTAVIAEVIFVGIFGNYSALTTGQPVFVNTSGLPTHTPPSTGMVQQVGFAVSATEIFFNFMQAIRRS